MNAPARHEAPTHDRPVRTPLALEPARHGSWASVWVLALGMGALYPWLLSMGSAPHHDWPAAPLGHLVLAITCLLPVVVRILTLRTGLAPTADERFSWHDHPERRAAYRAEVASRLPTTLRVLSLAPWPLGLLGWILYKTGI